MENLENVLLFVLAFTFHLILQSFVLLTLWSWFVVPVFDLKELKLLEVAGVMTIVNYIMLKIPRTSSDHNFRFELKRTTIISIFYAGLALSTGWVVHLYL